MSLAHILQTAEAGATNLTCPNCEQRIGILQFLRHVDPASITPNSYTKCPSCGAFFFSENALLSTIREQSSTGNSHFRFPLSIGSAIGKNITWVDVGETREHTVNNLYKPYEVDSVLLLGAERDDVKNEDDRLPFEILDDTYTRVSLGDEVMVSVTPVSPEEVVLTANLRESRSDSTEIEPGDEISVVYEEIRVLREVTNPPWINLLRGASESIRRTNTVAAIPMLVSAIDNCLYRQVYLFHRWQGMGHEGAHNHVVGTYGNDNGNIYREDFAKDALDEISGVRLTNGPSHREWQTFQEDILTTRNNIVHPTETIVEHIEKEQAIEWYNIIMDLILGLFDIVWFHDSE